MKNDGMVFAEKRAFKRVSAKISVVYLYGNMFYSGDILNLSEKGIFIRTKWCIPHESVFVLMIQVGNELLKVMAKVKRSARLNNNCDGIGIEIPDPSDGYLDFVKRQKTT